MVRRATIAIIISLLLFPLFQRAWAQRLLAPEEIVWQKKGFTSTPKLAQWGGEETGYKSTNLGFLLSFLLPGSGQAYAQSKGRSTIFLGVEAAVWAGFFGLRGYGGWLQDDYKLYAAEHAGIDPEGKDDEFFRSLAFYDSREEYNRYKLWGDREDAKPYGEDYYWEWENPQAKKRYKSIRDRSETAYQRAIYMLGLALLNRVVSSIDAVKQVRNYNKGKRFNFSKVKMEFHPSIGRKNIHLAVKVRF